MPGASRTRSLVRKWKKHTSKSPQVRRFDRPFPAQWFYGFLRALLGDQTFVVTVACERPRQLDASLGAPGPHVFAVRSGIARLTMHLRPSHPASRVVTFAKRPCRDGRRRLNMISGKTKENYFCRQDWTAQINLNLLEKSCSTRTPFSVPEREYRGRCVRKRVDSPASIRKQLLLCRLFQPFPCLLCRGAIPSCLGLRLGLEVEGISR